MHLDSLDRKQVLVSVEIKTLWRTQHHTVLVVDNWTFTLQEMVLC